MGFFLYFVMVLFFGCSFFYRFSFWWEVVCELEKGSEEKKDLYFLFRVVNKVSCFEVYIMGIYED